MIELEGDLLSNLMILNYFLLAVAITHLGYIFVDSYLMQFYRDWMARLGPHTKELSTCIICTSTQLSILLCWLVGPLFPSSNPAAYIISYLVSSLFLAKLSLFLGSLIEVLFYMVGSMAARSSSDTYEVSQELEDYSNQVPPQEQYN